MFPSLSQIYLPAVEEKQTGLRDKIWKEAWEWGLLTFNQSMLMFNHAVPDRAVTVNWLTG